MVGMYRKHIYVIEDHCTQSLYVFHSQVYLKIILKNNNAKTVGVILLLPKVYATRLNRFRFHNMFVDILDLVLSGWLMISGRQAGIGSERVQQARYRRRSPLTVLREFFFSSRSRFCFSLLVVSCKLYDITDNYGYFS